ncbi:hypothetical protein JCM8547_001708 [Rhodosporidiobolus lusitaniae]
MSTADIEAKVVKVPSGKRLFVDVIPGPSVDAPTIFFMHGLGSNTSFWEAPFTGSKLTQTYRLVRYDFDGHGLSPVSSLAAASGSGMLTLDDLVEDLGAVMDFVRVEKAAGIVGHSMSGLVASTFAARYPERVDKLFLLGAMRALNPAVQTSMLQRASTVRAHGLSAVVEGVISSALSSNTKANSPLSIAFVRALVLSTPPLGYAAACHALAGASNPDFGAIKAKTLVVAGAEDYLSNKETSDFFLEKITGAERIELDDVGHWPCLEAPVSVREVFEQFFL